MQASGPTLTLAGRTVSIAPRAALAAVVRETVAMPRPLQLWLGLLAGVLAVAAIAALLALPPGWEVLGTTPSFEWGLLIVGYVFFAILTSGLCLTASLGTVLGIERFRPLEKRHAILALSCLIAAFGIIALDLHYPVRLVFGAVFVPSPTSPMWWMGVFYGIYLCFLVVEVWSMLRGHPLIHQAACFGAACMAIIAPATLGAVFGVLAARPFWHGPFTPILMVASALLAGTSLLGIAFFVVHRLRLEGYERAASLAIPSIRLVLAVGLVVVALLVARQTLVGLAGGAPGLAEATTALVAGPLAWQFWILRVALGLVVPLALVVLPATRTPSGTFVAACLALIGVFVDRLTFVAAGQIAPTTTVSGVVSSPYATYTPSPVEIGILVGAAAFVALVYTLAERYLDLREADAHPSVQLAVAWLRRRLAPGRRLAPASGGGEVGDAGVGDAGVRDAGAGDDAVPGAGEGSGR